MKYDGALMRLCRPSNACVGPSTLRIVYDFLCPIAHRAKGALDSGIINSFTLLTSPLNPSFTAENLGEQLCKVVNVSFHSFTLR